MKSTPETTSELDNLTKQLEDILIKFGIDPKTFIQLLNDTVEQQKLKLISRDIQLTSIRTLAARLDKQQILKS
jgi:hypothetical protein